MRASLYTVEGLARGKVSMMARPRGGDWLLDEARALQEAGVDVLVSLLTPEEVEELDLKEEAASCQQQHIIFQTFPITDLSVPSFSAGTFSFLEQLHTYLSEGKHVVLHCRQGVGRSGLMAANLLVLTDFTPEQARDLLSKVRGCPVPETEEQWMWIKAYSQLSTNL